MVTRIAVWLLAIVVLTGCGSVRFASTTTPTSPTAHTSASASSTWTSGYTPAIQESAVETLQYGRFTVKVSPDGSQVIEGGEFVPSVMMSTTSSQMHVITINYTTKELSYYRRTRSGAYEPVVGYAVITPDPRVLPHNEVRGMVRRIDQSPSWCVTPQIREALRKKDIAVEAKCYPHGHPQNAMGAAKFEISWNTPGFTHVRLHGTSGYARGNFWDDTTLGCTRLHNEVMEKLIDELGPHAVKEGVEIIAMRGKASQEKEVQQAIISAE